MLKEVNFGEQAGQNEAEDLVGKSNGNIPFDDMCSLLESLGFEERTKGSHHIYTWEGHVDIINLQPLNGKCKLYQVRQVAAIIKELGL